MKSAQNTVFRRLAALLLIFSMLQGLCAFSEEIAEDSTDREQIVKVYIDRLLSGKAYVSDGILRFSLEEMCSLCKLDVTVEFCEEKLLAVGDGFDFYYSPEGYIKVNGRYLPCPEGYSVYNGKVLFSREIISMIFGAEISVDDELSRVDIPSSSLRLLEDGDSYYEKLFPFDEIDLLAHLIFAESGHSSLEGMIGVANVVLNRVASDKFPNMIHEVICQPNQFEPVDSGTIREEPNELSVAAAYLSLEGCNTVEDSIFFFELYVDIDSWMRADRFVCVIDYHKFYR